MKQVVIGAIAASVLFFASCGERKEYREMIGLELHTPYSVKYESSESYEDEIRQTMQEYYHAINPFDSASVISRVNRNEPVVVDSIFASVFTTAMQVAQVTGGALDVTCAPFINLWGFGFAYDSIDVTQDVIDSIHAFVGYEKVMLQDGRVVKKDPRVLLNFSALGDGCSCDLIGGLLEWHGVENYMVEVGGEVRARGVNQRGMAWRVGIVTPEDDPDGVNHDLQAVVALEGLHGLATSGNYRNFYEKDGRKYGHTIDPLSGYPACQDVLSATVIAPTAMEADAYATALMVMGRERAKVLACQQPDIAYYLIYIDSDDSIRTEYSSSFESFLEQ